MMVRPLLNRSETSDGPLGGERCLVVAPDWSPKRLAHTEADTHSDTDDEKDNDDLGDNAVATAETGKAVEPFACPGSFRLPGLLLPVGCARPHLAIAFVCCFPTNTAWW